jgi:tRNA (guanine26-N2/guanine27-N2)-dimethyltransferase
MQVKPSHYCEGQARLDPGPGFFRPDSRPARDCGVLMLRWLAQQKGAAEPLVVLDGLAGCGIRALRYGLEAHATEIWANDADPDRLPLLQGNLSALGGARCSAITIQKLLAQCAAIEQRFDFVDLDAFGAPMAVVPWALEAVRFGGVLYLASTDGRSFTGHDRTAALRRLGAAARAQPCSWELALRLQLGAIARSAWSLGRGVRPLLSFSDGRTFRTAVQMLRTPAQAEEQLLGLQGYCHSCGSHRGVSLLRWRELGACSCGAEPVMSGPLWRGPLQEVAVLEQLLEMEEPGSPLLAPASRRLLQRLQADDGLPAEASDLADLARQLQGGPPKLKDLLCRLQQGGWCAQASGIAPEQFRTDAPWAEVLAAAKAG